MTDAPTEQFARFPRQPIDQELSSCLRGCRYSDRAFTVLVGKMMSESQRS